jgi:hypothetical protein
VRHRQSLSGLTEEEALVVRYGQELVRQHRVSADTFLQSVPAFFPCQKGSLVPVRRASVG